MAWLPHESCTVHGEVFEAMAGRVGQSFTGSPDGFRDRQMTPETLVDSWSLVADADHVAYRETFTVWLDWQLGHAMTLARPAPAR